MALASDVSAADAPASSLNGAAITGVVLAIGVFLTSAGFFAMTSLVEHDQFNRLRHEATEFLAGVRSGITADIGILYSLRGLYAASNSVDRNEFKQFVRSVNKPASVLALEWIPRVANVQRADLELAARQDGLSGFQISELDEMGDMVRAGERDVYYPVYFMEPMPENLRALGFDLGSNPVRLAAMKTARDSGRMSASAPIELITQPRNPTGYLVFLPVYENGMPTATLEERRENLAGFALGVIHFSTLLSSYVVQHRRAVQQFAIEVFDRTEPGFDRQVFSAEPRQPSHDAATPGVWGISAVHLASLAIDLAGRRLDIRVAHSGVISGLSAWQPWFVLLLGLCLTGATAFCVRMMIDRSRFAEALVKQRTAELSETAQLLEGEILERGVAEQAMQASEKRLRDSIESISDGFALYDSEDRLVLWNSRYEEFDYRIRKHLKKDVTYQELTRLGTEAGQWRDTIVSKKVEAIDPRRSEPRERQLTDGRWLLIRSHPTSDGGLVDIRTDITDLKLQNEELSFRRKGLEDMIAARTRALEEQALQLAESLEKEKEYNALQHEFVSMVSHEFRTPLAIIDSTAQRIDRRKDSMTPDDLGQRVGKVRNAVKRLTVLIDDTLSMSRLEAGRIEVRPQWTDLRILLNEVREQQQQMTRRHHIEMDVVDLPESFLVDPELMRQVFINLLSNAVKYSPDADLVEVTGRYEHDTIVIAVRDYGLGIPAQDQLRLFDRFFRATNVTGIAGTGIGLNLVKRLVELHGGVLTFDSMEGEGSTFTVRLPVKTEAELIGCAESLCAASPIAPHSPAAAE